jgi:hypothetical protein
MKDILKTVFDYVFSFGMVMFLFFVGFLLLIGGIAEQTSADRKQTLALTEACYAQGMVLVRTDAGQRCVLPQSLVKIK